MISRLTLIGLISLVPAAAQANPLSDRLLTYPPATQASMLGWNVSFSSGLTTR